MYKVETAAFGIKLTFSDFVKEDEMTNWLNESRTALAKQSGKFGVYVDMRNVKAFPPESQKVLQVGQKEFAEKGMERSCVILQDAMTTMQLKRIGKETGIYAFERYIDASKNPKFESIGISWLKNAVDPDKS